MKCHDKLFIHINTAFVPGGKPPLGERTVLVIIWFCNNINMMQLSLALLLLLFFEVALENTMISYLNLDIHLDMHFARGGTPPWGGGTNEVAKTSIT